MFVILAAGMLAQDIPATAGGSLSNDPVSAARPGKGDYLDLEAGVGYSTNPFLSLDSGTGRALGRISARVVHSRWTERSSTSLSAYGENITYLGRYGSQLLARATAHHDESVTETLRLFGDLDASLDRSGQLGTRFIGFPSVSPVEVTPTPGLPADSNVNVFADGRTYSFSGQGGAQLETSPRDQWTLRAGYSRSMFRSNAIDSNVSDIFGSVAYDRKIDEQTTVGGIITARHSDYDGPGKVRVITPQVTLRKSLSSQTTVEGAVGVSFARIENGAVTRDSTGLAANATLCHSGEADRLCASVSRDQQTSSIGGPVTALTASASYARKLDANQSLQFSLSASRYTQPVSSLLLPLSIGRSEYLNAAGSYSRKLGNRWYAGANVSARKLYRDGPDPKADLGGSLFLRYRLGDVG